MSSKAPPPDADQSGLKDDLIVELSHKRIGELNRLLFNHRVFFATLIGSVIASLQFVKSAFSSGVGSEYEMAFAALLIVAILFLAMIIGMVVTLLDFLHLDLVENCVVVIREAEARNGRSNSSSIFNKARKGLTAVKMNAIVAIYYLLPIYILFLIIWILADIIISPKGGYSEAFRYLVDGLCRVRVSTEYEIPQNDVFVLEKCWALSESFAFASFDQTLVFCIILISFCFLSIITLNLICRIIRRLLLFKSLSSRNGSSGEIRKFSQSEAEAADDNSNEEVQEVVEDEQFGKDRAFSDWVSQLLSIGQTLFIVVSALLFIFLIVFDGSRVWLMEFIFY